MASFSEFATPASQVSHGARESFLDPRRERSVDCSWFLANPLTHARRRRAPARIGQLPKNSDVTAEISR